MAYIAADTYGYENDGTWSGDYAEVDYAYPEDEEVYEREGIAGQSEPERYENGQDSAEEETHLQKKDVYGYQKIKFFAHMTASRKDLANEPTLATWKLPEKELERMKFNIRKTNRNNATSKERVGDVTRVIPLDCRIIQAGNTFDGDLGITATGLEGRVCVGREPVLWTLPANNHSSNISEEVGDPDSVFTTNMFKKIMACDRKDLEKQLLMGHGSTPNQGLIDVKGHAWTVVMQHAHTPQFASYAQVLYDYDHKRKAGTLDSNMVPIPLKIASFVKNKIEKDIANIEKSYIDMNDFEIKFSRIDGRAWDDTMGLVGEAASYDTDSQNTLNSHTLTTPHKAYVFLELGYLI